ncbi:hypothetical protein SAMN05445756_0724 [Kytococcus aerolatus]|uniref:Biotin-protein ligase, N terminal n=1 Tax=Kytococcus aerolatus TaxID=592308 RepID=A0A212T931_9MICO|nr:hypothetical protein [Kytococcus aerolatus]SNC62567.1 hypothetical protein SAMN05445756_0724 [Kytococcus aerolatus]
MSTERFGPWAAVFRGRGAVPGCAEAVAAILEPLGVWCHYVGPGEEMSLGEALAKGPLVLAHPGGGTVQDEWERIGPDVDLVAPYVAGGGGYLGFCLGAYLAGQGPGYGIIRGGGDTDQWFRRPGADVTHGDPATTTIQWRGQWREVFVQDAPVLLVDEQDPWIRVLARYVNGDVAATLSRWERGWVGLTGPHPEATVDWYTDAGLEPPQNSTRDLAMDLATAVTGLVGR